jgi:hypothetical protein
MYVCLFLAAVLSICSVLVVASSSTGHATKATRWFAETLGGLKKQQGPTGD